MNIVFRKTDAYWNYQKIRKMCCKLQEQHIFAFEIVVFNPKLVVLAAVIADNRIVEIFLGES